MLGKEKRKICHCLWGRGIETPCAIRCVIPGRLTWTKSFFVLTPPPSKLLRTCRFSRGQWCMLYVVASSHEMRADSMTRILYPAFEESAFGELAGQDSLWHGRSLSSSLVRKVGHLPPPGQSPVKLECLLSLCSLIFTLSSRASFFLNAFHLPRRGCPTSWMPQGKLPEAFVCVTPLTKGSSNITNSGGRIEEPFWYFRVRDNFVLDNRL